MSWRAVPTSAAIAAFLLLPAPAWSAVPRSGNTFSPRTGAELLEAADAISTEGKTNASFKGVIQLSDAEYAVSRTVVLTSLAPATVLGPPTGRARITNSGTPTTLLRYSSQQAPAADAGVRGVDFTLKSSQDFANTIVVLDLQRGSAVRDSSVVVPSTTARATAVRLSPAQGTASPATSATLQGVQVTSAATDAPAVRATNAGQVLDSTITGGAPPLELVGDGSGADLGEVVVDASTVRTRAGSAAAVPVVRVRGGGVPLRPVLWSTVVDGTSGAAALVDVIGPSATTGSLEAALGQLTLRGVPSSIALRVAPSSVPMPVKVAARGLLSIGSKFVVNCSGTATSTTTVAVVGIYRETDSTNTSPTSCDFVESGRRSGPLAWRDEAGGDLRPVWDSPLVDAVPDFGVPAAVGGHDRSGAARFVQVKSGATPGDIGALEYQLSPPQDVVASFLPLGNRGLTALIGEGVDPDEQEQARLAFRWTLPEALLPDGKPIDSPVALVRFPTNEPVQAKLAVIDVTGVTVYRTITVQPNIRLDQPPTDSNDPDEPIEPIDPTVPTDPGSPQQPAVPLVPQLIVDGAGAPVPKLDPSLKQDYPPILKQVRATKRRVLTSRRRQPEYASARRGEAEIVIETWRKSEMTLDVTPILEGTGIAAGLPVASVPLKPFKGRKTLRIGGKVGKRKLKPGLYEMAITATPRPGAVPERAPFFVRVLRG